MRMSSGGSCQGRKGSIDKEKGKGREIWGRKRATLGKKESRSVNSQFVSLPAIILVEILSTFFLL